MFFAILQSLENWTIVGLYSSHSKMIQKELSLINSFDRNNLWDPGEEISKITSFSQS